MLRTLTLLILMMLSGPLAAQSFSFMPARNAQESELRNFVQAGNFRQALLAWPRVHQESDFGRTHNGRAMLAYLLYQNGMQHLGLELLVQRTQPNALDRKLLDLWTLEMKSSPLIQKGWVTTIAGWRSVANNEPLSLKMRNKRDIEAAFARAQRLPSNQINQKARIWWQIATLAPQSSNTALALKALHYLENSGQTAIGRDQIYSALGRVNFQRGELGEALNAYNKIPKSSPLWLESVEERAWVHLRRNDNDKALGEATTLLSPALSPLIGPESFYMANLMALKVCDYPRIFKNSENFKTRHRTRLEHLQELANTGSNKGLKDAMERFDKNGVSIESAGPTVEFLPRAVMRDATFTRAMESRRRMISDIQKAREFSSSLLNNSHVQAMVSKAQGKAQNNRQTALRRIRVLASQELDEYRDVLNKMHVVEAEVIQRLHVDESLKGKRDKIAKVKDEGEVLIFPYSSDEVWFDELDSYKARVKDCPTLKGASL